MMPFRTLDTSRGFADPTSPSDWSDVNPHEHLIESFYAALRDADIDGVRACYAPDVVYFDPVFRELRGERAIAMWDMFFHRDDQIRVEFSNITADQTTGSGQWIADYDLNGRHIHNIIQSRFTFADGRIVEHRDDFDVHKWATEALGPLGRLAGWAPPVKTALHRRSRALLDTFERKRDR